MFAYPDAQRYRLGANYTQLPPNRPVVPVYAPYERDGAGTMTRNYGGDPNYVRSRYTSASRSKSAQEVRHDEWLLRSGAVLGLNEIPVDEEDYTQPRDLWRRVFDDEERRKWVATVSRNLAEVPPELQKAAIEMFGKVDPQIAEMLVAQLKETPRL